MSSFHVTRIVRTSYLSLASLLIGVLGVLGVSLPSAHAELLDVVAAPFDASSEGFDYGDDLFRNTDEPSYASGTFLPSGGRSGGGLSVVLGGIDAADIFDMSGGWETDFDIQEGDIGATVSFSYNLTQAANYENDEFSQLLLSVDGVLIGQNADDFVAEIVGNGNGGSNQTTGWQTFSVDLGPLSAGTHTRVRSPEMTHLLVENGIIV